MKRINYLIDTKQLHARKTKKFVLFSLAIVSIILCLVYISVFGLGRYWWILIAGGISFASSMGLVIILILLYTVIWNVYMIKKHPDLWKRTFLRISIRERVSASQDTRLLKDPFLEKTGFLIHKAGMIILKFWFLAFSVFVLSALIWDAIKNMH